MPTVVAYDRFEASCQKSMALDKVGPLVDADDGQKHTEVSAEPPQAARTVEDLCDDAVA